MHKLKMDFAGWNYVEIMTYLFCENDSDKMHVIKLVDERLSKGNDHA